LGDLGDRIDGGAAAVGEMLARGVVEGEFEPRRSIATGSECPPT